MRLTPAQSQILSDTHRFRVLVCGRKFGKTELAIEEILCVALSKRDKEIVYLATNFGEARDIAWSRMNRRYKSVVKGEPNKTILEMYLYSQDGGTSHLQLKGWESVETLRGREFDFIVLDETQNYKDFWMYWQEVLRPTLTPRRGSALFLGTPKGFNHFYDLRNQEARDDDFKSFHFTTYDNPYLPVDEIESARKQLTQDRFAQEYLADFRKSEGLVFKEFSREKHIYSELPSGDYRKFGGIDWGYVNPAAILDIRFNGKRFYVEDEWYKSGRTDAMAAEYASKFGFEAVYPDPENQGAIEELRQRQVSVRDVFKGKGSVAAGIQKIRELLLSGRLLVNAKCLNLISEFESYSYEDDKRETPIDDNNHALSALRYVISMNYEATPIAPPKEWWEVREEQQQIERKNPAR